MNKDLAPTQLKVNNAIINNPKIMANTFNRIFIDKIKKLRTKTNQPPKSAPIDRLKKYLNKRNEPLPDFILTPITIEQLRITLERNKISWARFH